MKLFLILLLINSLYNFFRKKRTNGILSCGLFAHISNFENSAFSWDKFNYLGRDNDERGGDSVGRVVGDEVQKYINSKKTKTTYEDFVITYKNTEPSNIAIGHTRKASVGGLNPDLAQPVVLDLPDESGGKFAMVHNGTIHNYQELARKYGVNTTGKNDSYVLAEIIMNNGFGVLEEYEGAAAIIIKDDRNPNTLFMFKGESLNYADKMEEERPLFYWQESKESVYISSKVEGLYFIGGDIDSTFAVKSNTVFAINNGVVSEVQAIDRTKQTKNKQYGRTTTTNSTVVNNNRFNTRNYNEHFNYSNYYSEEWDDDELPFRGVLPAASTSTKISIIDENFDESLPNDSVVFCRFRYWRNTNGGYKLLNGMFHLNEYGIIYDAPIKLGFNTTKVYYFYKGVMLKNKITYDKVNKLLGKAKKYNESTENTVKLVKLAMHPICTLKKMSYSDLRVASENDTIRFFTGTFNPLFSRKSYDCTGSTPGELYKIKELGLKTKADHSSPIPPVEEEIIETVEEDDDVKEDPIIIEEVDNALKMLLIAIEGAKNVLSTLNVESKMLDNFSDNLNDLEDSLYDDSSLKTKKIIVKYEEF